MALPEERTLSNMMQYFEERVAERIDGEVFVVYCMYKMDDQALPFDNLNEIAHEGIIRIHMKHIAFWDQEGTGEDFLSEEITNPTNLDIAVIVNRGMQVVNDKYTHKFLEKFDVHDGEGCVFMGS